jgi:hypothetical protein
MHCEKTAKLTIFFLKLFPIPLIKVMKPSNTELVTAHIQKLDPVLGNIVQTIRDIILSVDAEIGEEIKWNNPAFFYTGEMKPFDPKEFKRHIIVMNLHKGRLMLVFPSGAKINDTSGFLEGDYKDGRRLTVFKDKADVLAKKEILQNVIKMWLTLVEK